MTKKATLEVTIKGGPKTGKSTVAQIAATALQSYGLDVEVTDDSPFSAFVAKKAEALSEKIKIEIATERPREEVEESEMQGVKCEPDPSLAAPLKDLKIAHALLSKIFVDENGDETHTWEYCKDNARFTHSSDFEAIVYIPSGQLLVARLKDMLDYGCNPAFVEICKEASAQGFHYVWFHE